MSNSLAALLTRTTVSIALLFGLCVLFVDDSNALVAAQNETNNAKDADDAPKPQANDKPIRKFLEARQRKSRGETNKDEATEPKGKQAGDAAPDTVLSGRIVDDTGAPVTDAKLELSHGRRGRSVTAETDSEGKYSFKTIERRGTYMLSVTSERCISLVGPGEAIRVQLSPNAQVVREIKLHRACQLQIETVDEAGKPVAGVMVCAQSAAERETRRSNRFDTDADGRVKLALKAEQDDYLIGMASPNYGFEKLTIKLDDPNHVETRRVVLRAGVEVRGTAICSDDKPAANCDVTAFPDWWSFNSFPPGQPIADDGSFVLPHIVPDTYNVNVTLQIGKGKYRSLPAIKSIKLPNADQPLAAKINFPSPASLVAISGHVEFKGDDAEAVAIEARNDTLNGFSMATVDRQRSRFQLDGLPPGKYKLSVLGQGAILKEMLDVVAPTEDLTIEVGTQGDVRAQGTVLQKGRRLPVSKFRVRGVKLKTLKGPPTGQDLSWKDVESPDGKFDINLFGAGVYEIEVAAPEYAPVRKGPIVIDESTNAPLEFELEEGARLSGSIFDVEGKPVVDARVILVPELDRQPGTDLNYPLPEAQSIPATRGEFRLRNLAPDPLIMCVIHPDYAPRVIRTVPIGDGAGASTTIKVKLHRGGAIRGRVYDEQGKPEANVTLVFETRGNALPSGDHPQPYPTAVTDENGDYEVKQLPPLRLCYVHRQDNEKTSGVVRQAVVPEDEQTVTLNFGGGPKLTGRLLLNGSPLSNVRLSLVAGRMVVGMYTAYSTTSADGSFVVSGVRTGEHTLCIADEKSSGERRQWTPFATVKLTGEDQDVGTIDKVTAKLTVQLAGEGADPGNTFLRLHKVEDGASAFARDAIAKLAAGEQAFVFPRVTPGRYELSAVNQKNWMLVKQNVEISADNLQPTLTLQWPNGTATLRGKVVTTSGIELANNSFVLRQRDDYVKFQVLVNETGEYKVTGIPAGEYLVTLTPDDDAWAIMTISIDENEQKVLDLTPDSLRKSKQTRGLAVVQAYGTDGVPLSGCEIRVEGEQGKLVHTTFVDGDRYQGIVGKYAITVSYPGYETHKGEIELFPANPNRYFPDDNMYSVVKLKPARR